MRLYNSSLREGEQPMVIDHSWIDISDEDAVLEPRTWEEEE